MSAGVTRETLDRMGCQCGRPACEDPVYVHSACHPSAPTWAKYFDGALTIVCVKCGAPVLRVAVASKAASDG